MDLKLQTEDQVFMSYEFHNLFGLIRISKEAIYVFSIYNKEKHDGSFKRFMEYIESSKKPVIMLNVRNAKLWHHFNHKGYRPYNGKVKGTGLSFVQSLIKYPKND